MACEPVRVDGRLVTIETLGSPNPAESLLLLSHYNKRWRVRVSADGELLDVEAAYQNGRPIRSNPEWLEEAIQQVAGGD